MFCNVYFLFCCRGYPWRRPSNGPPISQCWLRPGSTSVGWSCALQTTLAVAQRPGTQVSQCMTTNKNMTDLSFITCSFASGKQRFSSPPVQLHSACRHRRRQQPCGWPRRYLASLLTPPPCERAHALADGVDGCRWCVSVRTSQHYGLVAQGARRMRMHPFGASLRAPPPPRPMCLHEVMSMCMSASCPPYASHACVHLCVVRSGRAGRVGASRRFFSNEFLARSSGSPSPKTATLAQLASPIPGTFVHHPLLSVPRIVDGC